MSDLLIGCRSLTIHRVESVLSTETALLQTVPSATFDCVNKLQLIQSMKNGITRNTQSDRKIDESLTMPLQRGVKVIGSSD